MPRLNALLNGLSAVALCAGLYFIKHKNVHAHRASMLVGFGFSSLFLVSYIVNHALRGDTHFPGIGTARTVYLSILTSHILLSIAALPLVLSTLLYRHGFLGPPGECIHAAGVSASARRTTAGARKPSRSINHCWL